MNLVTRFGIWRLVCYWVCQFHQPKLNIAECTVLIVKQNIAIYVKKKKSDYLLRRSAPCRDCIILIEDDEDEQVLSFSPCWWIQFHHLKMQTLQQLQSMK